ncbi:AraC family transcriptional regulator [Pedobacter sp. UBA4863]|uniref:AraC family transcriptional regulator n=1 Tax=Pedobacter sp. UBA4863 TaxID=1947060 RepID=UPI0025D1C3B1|nr:AraC family transcriptional regulator [Pedobacter sp. UBA4863]
MKVLNQITMSDADEQSIIVQDITFVDYLHCHKELQIAYIYKGHGTLIIGNNITQFEAGEVYIIGENQPHMFKSADSEQENTKAVNVYLNHRGNLADLFSIPEMQQIKKFLENADYGFRIPKEHTDTAIKSIRKIEELSGLDRLMETLNFFKQLVLISGWKPLSTGLYNYSFDGTDRLESIYKYTIEHYHNNITLKVIASHACMTPHAFCKYFKKYTRKTYLNFLNEYRVGEACKKILSGKYDCISAIAYRTGFSSIITFNRVFKKAMGITPTEYKEEFQKRESLMDIRDHRLYA